MRYGSLGFSRCTDHILQYRAAPRMCGIRHKHFPLGGGWGQGGRRVGTAHLSPHMFVVPHGESRYLSKFMRPWPGLHPGPCFVPNYRHTQDAVVPGFSTRRCRSIMNLCVAWCGQAARVLMSLVNIFDARWRFYDTLLAMIIRLFFSLVIPHFISQVYTSQSFCASVSPILYHDHRHRYPAASTFLVAPSSPFLPPSIAPLSSGHRCFGAQVETRPVCGSSSGTHHRSDGDAGLICEDPLQSDFSS